MTIQTIKIEYEQKLKKAKGKISVKTFDDATMWAKKHK